jgi:hypothetical protein
MKALYYICANACRMRMLFGILLPFTNYRISFALPSFKKEGFSTERGTIDDLSS